MAPTMKRLSYMMTLGGEVHGSIRQIFENNPSFEDDIMGHVGLENCTALNADITTKIKEAIRSVLLQRCPNFSFSAGSEHTIVDTELLDLWRQAAKDPDPEPVEWLKWGAPSGLLEEIPDRGIFPTYDPAIDIADVTADSLETQSEFCNYQGVEADEDVAAELERLVKNKFARRFKTLAAARAYLNADPILSKIGVVKKLRSGKWKI